MAFGTKAKMRGPVVDTLANLKFAGSKESNQVQFRGSKERVVPTGPNRSNQQKSQGNTKGTGKFGVESSIALSSKRIVGLSLKKHCNY